MMQCLTEIIGVTKSDCQCIISNLTEEQKLELAKSTSGLYLDDLEGGVHLKALNNVDACRKMYAMAIAARDNAIKRLQDDLVIAVNSRYKKERSNYAGTIGRMSFAQSLTVSKPLQGMRIRPNSINDGMITMNRLQIILNAAVTVDVKLYRTPYNTVVGEEIASWPVTTVANAYVPVTLTGGPVKMPLVVDGEMVDYYLLYDIQAPGVPVQPKDNGINCANCDKGKAAFADYVTVSGIQLDSTSQLNQAMIDSYSHGLIMDVEINCDNETLFCREYIEDDAVAITMAYAAWYKAGELLIEDVLKQPDVSRYTTMAREYLWGKRNHFKKEYENRIAYLSAVIDITQSNCYVCRETANQPFFGAILS